MKGKIMAYTEEEKKEFHNKDLRINRTAILKSLIESGRNSANEVEENKIIADSYVDYVYNGLTGNTSESVVNNWVAIAKELNLDKIPNKVNIAVLDSLWNEYKSIYKLSANPAILLSHIIDKFNKYPTNNKSIKTILNSLETEK